MRARISLLATIGIATLLALVCLSGCASTHPAPPKAPEPAPPAIAVDGGLLPALAFDKLIVDIPDHRLIGFHHEGLEYTRMNQYWWSPDFAKETDKLNGVCLTILDGAGYRVAADADALAFVGTMRDFNFNSYSYKSSFDQVECEMFWELYRVGEAKPFFTKVTTGAGRVDHNQPGAILAAFERALGLLLADEEFVAAVGRP